MIINLLGIDGSGKSTHITRLAEEIQNSFKVNTRVISKADIMNEEIFPEAQFFRVPYEVLAMECLPYMKGNSRAMWLLYMFSVIVGKFPPADNEVVIMDGFWQKNYGSEVALGVDKNWFKAVCSMFPQVDFTIMLDVTPIRILSNRKKRLTPYECGLDVECKETSFVAHQTKMREAYMELLQEMNSVIINADADKEIVYGQIRDMAFNEVSKIYDQKTNLYQI